MKKLLLLILIFLSIAQLVAQEKDQKINFKFGTGVAFMGSGDMLCMSFENELNYKLNSFFSTGMALNYGRSEMGVDIHASFVQANLNFFLAPTKKQKPNHFKFGVGLSYLNAHNAWLRSEEYQGGVLIDRDHRFDDREILGGSLIIENEYTVKDQFLLGAKVMSSQYANGELITSAYLKVGWVF